MRGLKDKTVVVTGGASGIGKAVVTRLGEEGAKVAILDLNAEGADAVAAEINAAGGTARGYAADITDYDAVETAIAAVEEDLGPIGGLVNNAGWDKMVFFIQSDPELWRKIVDINLYGPVNVTHCVIKRMAERREGRIVSVASDAGRVGSSGEGVYSACKGGIIALMKTLARENASKGIACNAVAPGPTDTPLFAGFDPDGKIRGALERSIPMRRLGDPSDYPGIIAFLLSDDAGFITGQTISVSGGLTMHG